MAGFAHSRYEGGRIPCPHCSSTDCAGVRGQHLICCYTEKIVTEKQLRGSAEQHGFTLKPKPPRRETIQRAQRPLLSVGDHVSKELRELLRERIYAYCGNPPPHYEDRVKLRWSRQGDTLVLLGDEILDFNEDWLRGYIHGVWETLGWQREREQTQ
jgi:hypothetical protein